MQLWQASSRLKTQLLATLTHHQHFLLSTSVCRYLNHYEVLGLPPDCSQTDVKDAFVKLSKQWHPDRQSPAQQKSEPGKFVELNAAYSVLSKPQLRAQYDAQLRALEKGYYNVYDNYTVHTHASRQEFTDEDAFYGRPHGKDEGAKGRSYYGVPWIKERLPNSTIVSLIVTFMVLGMVVHFYIARVSREYYARRAELRDRQIATSYRQVRERALGRDRAAQLLQFEHELSQAPDAPLDGELERERNKKFIAQLAE